MMMMTGPPEDPVTAGIFSLEVRWILPGSLDLPVAQWYGAFPSEAESREDAYIPHPEMAGLSVKVRASRALEATAAVVFTRPLPPGADLRLQESLSYAEWLRQPLCITPRG
jgi:hypothetical protein